MEVTVERFQFSDLSTISQLYVDDVELCYILEDKDRNLFQDMDIEIIKQEKLKGITAIPYGRYQVEIGRVSPRFGRMLPWIKDVPGFEYILIHSGNTAKDTDGCLITGMSYKKDFVGESKKALELLINKLVIADNSKEEIFLNIIKRQ